MRRVSGLGSVCESCVEVVDIVIETEIERVNEATEKVLDVLRKLEER